MRNIRLNLVFPLLLIFGGCEIGPEVSTPTTLSGCYKYQDTLVLRIDPQGAVRDAHGEKISDARLVGKNVIIDPAIAVERDSLTARRHGAAAKLHLIIQYSDYVAMELEDIETGAQFMVTRNVCS